MDKNSLDVYHSNKEKFVEIANKIFMLLDQYGEHTAEDLVDLLGIEITSVRPRLSELKSKGLVIVSQRVKNAKNITVNAYSVNPKPPREEYKQIKRYSNLFLQEEFKDELFIFNEHLNKPNSGMLIAQAIVIVNKLEKLLR